jgi:hypothetical protein
MMCSAVEWYRKLDVEKRNNRVILLGTALSHLWYATRAGHTADDLLNSI